MSLPVFDMVVFGGTGDLALRKLFPGLFSLYLDNRISEDSRILLVSRSDIDKVSLYKKMRSFIRDDLVDSNTDLSADSNANKHINEVWVRFLSLIDHVSVDITSASSMASISAFLSEDRCRIFYKSG